MTLKVTVEENCYQVIHVRQARLKTGFYCFNFANKWYEKTGLNCQTLWFIFVRTELTNE